MIFAILTLVLLLILSTGQAVLGQQPPAQQTDEIVRINTELVQTGVSVFDKQGRFVDGLKKDDFELRVDGRLVAISVFENIVAGSQRDRSVRGLNASTPATGSTSELSFRQRTIVFFVDDRHLSLDSVGRTRKILSEFVDKEMGQNDLVAIASTSGQIGFLQQFTDNKDVLRAAVSRLNHVPYVVTDYAGSAGNRMTENMALAIERKDDSNVFEFYVQECHKTAPRGVTRQERSAIRRHCEIEVQNRARAILTQAGAVTANTYYSLETLLRSAERMPGSKLAFFISDGFLSDTGPRGPIGRDQVQRITDDARRAGVVIYTIDARGLISGALDATGDTPFDPNGRLESANLREIAASQDALHALAEDTGGRALRNQNYFDKFINEALTETSRYYLIAWRPEGNEEKSATFKKIALNVIGRPDLTVRSARGFVNNRTVTSTREEKEDKTTANQQSKADADLSGALKDSYSRQALPLQLSLIYLDTPASGIVLTSSIQALAEVLSYGDQGKDPAQLSIAGVVLNDQGKPAGNFKTGLKVNPPSSNDEDSSNVIYNHRSQLKPGIYQVRVAARDDRSGIVGSAMQWIAIPDLSTGRLSLSSLIVGLKNVGNKSDEAGQMQWSVDKKFGKDSSFTFLTFIYNAQYAASYLVARVQVYKDEQKVISTPFKTVAFDKIAGPARVPFISEINLAGVQPGRYVLEVTVEDRASHKSASQRSDFYVY